MEILVKNRTVLGKKVKFIRREGKIPAEIYGRGLANRHVEIDSKAFKKLFKSAGEHTLIEAITEENEKIPVLISDAARHPITGEVLSVDLRVVRLDEKIKRRIPIELIGSAPATKSGFVIIRALEELEVEALPHKLPHKIEIDVSMLETPGQNIHVGDIKLGSDVEIINLPDAVVVTVKEKTKEEEAPAPAPAAEGASVPETESAPEEAAQNQAKTPTEKS